MKLTYREYPHLKIKIMEIDEFLRSTAIDNYSLIELLISMAKKDGSYVDSLKNMSVIVGYGYIPDELISDDLKNKIVNNKGENK